MALQGIKVLEFAGLAPAPYCGMILADLGATVTRIDRAGGLNNVDVMARGKRSFAVNLKKEEGVNLIKRISQKSDVLIEPFRKGVMEKLGLGPDVLRKGNPGLIYARLTGYGQYGPYANKAGHDINYIALSGLLSRLGRKNQPPYAPINIVADFAGGGMVCALGILSAIIERGKTKQGQVIDSNMVEGAAYVGSWLFKSQELFIWGKPRGENMLDSGAHFYETYETKDGKYMAVGALEPQFYDELLKGLGFTLEEAPHFSDFDATKEKFRERFLEKTRKEWTGIFESLDACVTPVLEFDEVHQFQHNKQRNSFPQAPSGYHEPAPAPRLSNHQDSWRVISNSQPIVGQNTEEVLLECGYSKTEIESLVKNKVVDTESSTQSKL